MTDQTPPDGDDEFVDVELEAKDAAGNVEPAGPITAFNAEEAAGPITAFNAEAVEDPDAGA